MAAPTTGGCCRAACISTSSRHRAPCSSSGSCSAESDHGSRHRRHRHRRALGASHVRLPLGRAGRPSPAPRLRRGRPASPRRIRAPLASGEPRGAVALPPRPLGRAADAGVRAEIHDGAPTQRAARDPRAARRGAAAADARRGIRPLVARPRVPDRHPRRARRRAVPPERRREPGDVSGAAHDGERGAGGRGAGRPPGVHRRHGTERRARALGNGLRPAPGGVFPARGDGDGHSPDARTGGGAGPGRSGETPSLDALLSSGRDYGPGRARRDAVQRVDRRGPRRRSVHHRREVAVLIVMRHGATPDEVQKVVSVIEEMGYQARPMPGAQRTAVGLVGNDGRIDASRLAALPGVVQIIHVTQPYKQVSREWRAEDTVVTIAPGVSFGGSDVPIIAGPCSVESEDQIVEAAHIVKAAGGTALRGGAFKPRSSPYAFQGLGKRGLELLALARRETGLPIVTEAMDNEGAHLIADMGDCIQIGARNMQNYSLLKTVGRLGKPVLLKRGMAATITDLLLSAEYILSEGNPNVILCERGVRTFDPAARNLLDLTSIPIVHRLSHLPIIADPSHGTGLRDKVTPMARAAVAAGADGVMIEVHPEPDRALSDGPQSLYPEQYATLVKEIRAVATAIGRSVPSSPPAPSRNSARSVG